jgi:hypothetical protein
MQSKHNPKKKQKRTINKKSSKDPMQRGLMIKEMTINDNKEDLKQKSLTIFGLNLSDHPCYYCIICCSFSCVICTTLKVHRELVIKTPKPDIHWIINC